MMRGRSSCWRQRSSSFSCSYPGRVIGTLFIFASPFLTAAHLVCACDDTQKENGPNHWPRNRFIHSQAYIASFTAFSSAFFRRPLLCRKFEGRGDRCSECALLSARRHGKCLIDPKPSNVCPRARHATQPSESNASYRRRPLGHGFRCAIDRHERHRAAALHRLTLPDRLLP